VNNESIEILKILNTSFNHLLPESSAGRELDLFPSALTATIDEANSWIYPQINNGQWSAFLLSSISKGVYRAGFAQSQQAYEEAVNEVFQALDRCEEILANSRYVLTALPLSLPSVHYLHSFICSSDQITAMDIRLFMTLIRFDEVYVVYFKA
jgi:glutathionyl-hydroquinone reductase